MDIHNFNILIFNARQHLNMSRQRLDTILVSLSARRISLSDEQKDQVTKAQREQRDAAKMIDDESISNDEAFSSTRAESFQRSYQAALSDADKHIDQIFLV